MPALSTVARNGVGTREKRTVGAMVARSADLPDDFPFRRVLSLEPLISFIYDSMCAMREDMSLYRAEFEGALAGAPELLEPIDDLAVIDRHKDVVDRLMSVLFPPANWDRDVKAAIIPYSLTPFYSTPSFQWLMAGDNGEGAPLGRLLSDPQFLVARTLTAYLRILREFYGISLDFGFPVVAKVPDPSTGLIRSFRIEADPRFMKLKAVGPTPPLSEADTERLMENLTDLSVWKELIPSDKFEFHGFALITAVEVTDQQSISELTAALVNNDSIVSQEGFANLQVKLRTLMRRPNLTMAISALEGGEILILNYGARMDTGCFFTDAVRYGKEDFSGSVFERAMVTGEAQIIENIETYSRKTPVEEEILRKGYRNVLVAPLKDHDQVIGALTLWSDRPGDINALNSLKLNEILPLFAVAVKRSIDDISNRMQRVIREQYTAIHPSVEWRFRRAAFEYIRRQQRGEQPTPEPIVFHDVYPLFGESDVRGSSVQRNLAIQSDLVEQLELARDVVQTARLHRDLPILDNIAYRITTFVDNLRRGLHSGDEPTVLDVLRYTVEPLFEQLSEFHPDVARAIEVYRSQIDSELGIIYNRRRDFEESVTLLNRTVAAYIDAEEERAQAMFPHYFEQHQTDGVDFGLYVGASLVEDGTFDMLYLKNLRLWQLMVLCGVARRSHGLKPRMKAPLDTTQLILVQSTPLSIRFRHDEKQFDVDGAYNIRYEIMKKRIDKATIKGTDERLTQPGTIAIVYSQVREASEYREYIDYLQSIGYLSAMVEDLELDDLQGIQGLKALRVTVNVEGAAEEIITVPEHIEQAVRSMAEAAD